MTTTTIKSNARIVYNNSLNLYQQSIESIYNQYSFKKHVTYRRYVMGEDNLSGDKDFRDYNDYEIYAEVQLEGESKEVDNQGYIHSSFGFIYLPAIVKETRDGTGFPSFRPQIKDEFYFDGRWYIIENVLPLQFTTNAFSMECMFRLISTSDNPRTPNI